MLLSELYQSKSREKNFFFRNPLLKIANCSINKGNFRFRRTQGVKNQTLRIVISFGREFVLWDGEQFVVFRVGSAESPLQMGFNSTKLHKTEDPDVWTAEFTPDDVAAMDQLVQTIMGKVGGSSIDYSEINPSFLASMTIEITLGKALIDTIEGFDLSLKYQAN